MDSLGERPGQLAPALLRGMFMQIGLARSLGSRVKTAARILNEGIKSKREPRSQSEGDDTWFLLLLLTDGSHVVGCVNTQTVHHALHDTQASYALFLAELGGVESVGDRQTV